ncbi:MAG: RNA polymerase sigma factor [Candidatus Aminicenantes bacterium]|nr:RNA polymerase sigma factor [Candidatus Aminicenantes bacterium]
MLQLKEGDLDKLGILFERHKKNLFGFFFKITYDRDVSEDMVQEVFIKILKYKDSFRGYGKFSTWMYSIAHNVSVDHFRKQNKYVFSEDSERLISVEDHDHELNTIRDERFDMLNRAMLKLVPDKREILTLSKIDGLKYKELGRILNCSENTVKGRVFRALKELKNIYSKMEVPDK